MIGLGATDGGVEDPTESSAVCGLPAPLADGLGDCEGPTGLKQKESHN